VLSTEGVALDEGMALFPAAGTVTVWATVVEMVLLTVTEVVITEGVAKTVVEPAVVRLWNVREIHKSIEGESYVKPTGQVVTVVLTTSVT